MVSLLSNTALSAILGLVRSSCAAAGIPQHADDTAMDEESPAQDARLCGLVLSKLATLLASHGMGKQPDMLLPLMDTLGEAARSSCATGALTRPALADKQYRHQCHADGVFTHHATTCPETGRSGTKGSQHDLA